MTTVRISEFDIGNLTIAAPARSKTTGKKRSVFLYEGLYVSFGASCLMVLQMVAWVH